MAGYALRLNGTFLDVFAEQEVSFSVESSLLSDSILPGVLSLPFSLPLSQKNKQLLGNLNLLEYWEYDTIYECELWMEGNYFRSGRIIINSADKASADITFSEFDSEKQFDTVTLQDLDFPKYDISIERTDKEAPLPAFYDELKARLQDDYTGERDFVSPTVYNESADGTNEAFPYDKNEAAALRMYLQNFYANDFSVQYLDFDSLLTSKGKYYANNAVSLFLYNNYVLQKVFNKFNVVILENYLAAGEFSKLILYTNRAINLFNFDKSLTYMVDFYPDRPAYNMLPRFYEDVVNVAEFAPKISITAYLKGLKNLFNLVYDYNKQNKTVSIRNRSNVIAEMQEIDVTELSANFTKWTNSKADIHTNIIYTKFQDRIKEIITKDYNFKGSVDVLPGTANDNDLYYLTTDDKCYVYKSANSAFEKVIENGINGTEDGYFPDKSKTLDLSCDVALNSVNIEHKPKLKVSGFALPPAYANFVYRLCCPVVNASIKTKNAIIDNTEHNDYIQSLIFMFYRGMVSSTYDTYDTSNLDFEFPYASVDAKPAFWNGTDSDQYNESLEMFGPKGIYQRHHKKWMDYFTKTRQVDIDIRIHAHQIDMLLNNKIRVQSASFITKKLTFKASPSQIKPCKAEMYQIMQ